MAFKCWSCGCLLTGFGLRMGLCEACNAPLELLYPDVVGGDEYETCEETLCVEASLGSQVPSERESDEDGESSSNADARRLAIVI